MGKCDWTMDEAQQWVREHKDFMPPEEKMAENETAGNAEIDKESLGQVGGPEKVVNYTDLQFAIQELTAQIAELKEGRALSVKNRTLIKESIDALATLKERLEELHGATELSAREEGKGLKEGEFILEKNGKQGNLDDSIAGIVEKLFEGDRISRMMNDAIKEALDVGIKKKLGKVE